MDRGSGRDTDNLPPPRDNKTASTDNPKINSNLPEQSGLRARVEFWPRGGLRLRYSNDRASARRERRGASAHSAHGAAMALGTALASGRGLGAVALRCPYRAPTFPLRFP